MAAFAGQPLRPVNTNRLHPAALLLALVLLAAALGACGSASAQSEPTPAPAPATATPPPTATVPPTATPTSTPPPTATPTLMPSPTPAPRLRQLTTGECCTQPAWLPDSKQIYFIDKPSDSAPSGYYSVDVSAPAAPKLMTERVAFYTADMQYVTTVDALYANIERLSDGQKFRIRTGGRNVQLSPDRTRAVWAETPQVGPNDERVTQIMGANIDGSEARPIVSLLRGGVGGWLDDDRLLLTARTDPKSQEVVLFAFSLSSGARTELARSERLRGTLTSPGGDWIAYTINFDSNAQNNGTWLVSTDGKTRRKLPFFGSFQWRDRDRIIYIPLELNKASHVFYEYDARRDLTRALTDIAASPIKIANGDWAVSPDGRKVVFLNAKDRNLWLWDLP